MRASDVLLAERQARKLDLIRADLREIKQVPAHQVEMFERCFRHIEACISDQETRLRHNTEAVTGLKVRSVLASGGSWLVSAAAFIKAFTGG